MSDNHEHFAADQYGRYVIDTDDQENQLLPNDATLSEKIADILRTEDRWSWREALNIHGYDVFELLRAAQKRLRAVEEAYVRGQQIIDKVMRHELRHGGVSDELDLERDKTDEPATDLAEFLERVDKLVSEWPAWKRGILGMASKASNEVARE